jgi:hypothetical protein
MAGIYGDWEDNLAPSVIDTIQDMRDTDGIKKITDPVTIAGLPLPTGASTSAKQDEIINALKQFVEADMDTGTATGGSTTTVVDTSKVWIVNDWSGSLVEVKIGAKSYYAHVLSNTADTITFTAALAEAVVAGCEYKIKVSVIQTNDIRSISGTSLTAADWTTIFQSMLASVNLVKDTDGVKKITDALPAGNNKVGQVAIAHQAVIWEGSLSRDTVPPAPLSLESAPGPGLSLYITDIIISNGATPGTFTVYEDPDDTIAILALTPTLYIDAYSGVHLALNTPIKATENFNVGYDATGVTNHSIMLVGYTA